MTGIRNMACKRCRIRPITHNGYCRECDPSPAFSRLLHSEKIPVDACVMWQTSEDLPDGRTATVVNTLSNRQPQCANCSAILPGEPIMGIQWGSRWCEACS